MKPRPTPRPINYKRPLSSRLASDPQVRKWAKRLAGDDSVLPTDLSEEQLAFAMLEVSRRRPDLGDLDEGLFLKAMSDTCPVVVAPRLDRLELAGDLELIFRQPEMHEFFRAWEGERARKGPRPDFLTGKALATMLGMSGIAPTLMTLTPSS